MLALLLFSCMRAPEEAPAVTPAADVAPALPPGRVTVTVTGPTPPAADGACPPPATALEAGGEVAGAVVVLDAPGGDAPPAAKTLELGPCGLSEWIVGLPPASALAIHSAVEDARELRAVVGADEHSRRALPSGATVGLPLPRTGRVALDCGEGCSALVILGGFVGQTGADGAVSLIDVPVGAHTVTALHPALGEAKGSVQVAEGEDVALSLHFGELATETP